MDAIQFLKQEHRKAKAAFGKLIEAAPTRRGELWQDLQPKLKAHEEIEQACLYGPLAAEHPSDSTVSDWIADGHENEVNEVEGLLGQSERLDPKDDLWLTTVHQIRTALENHIRQEEREIFPRISKVWDQSRRTAAGEQMSAMKAEKVGRR